MIFSPKRSTMDDQTWAVEKGTFCRFYCNKYMLSVYGFQWHKHMYIYLSVYIVRKKKVIPRCFVFLPHTFLYSQMSCNVDASVIWFLTLIRIKNFKDTFLLVPITRRWFWAAPCFIIICITIIIAASVACWSSHLSQQLDSWAFHQCA